MLGSKGGSAMAVDDIRLVVDSCFQIQKLRVQVGNRLNAVERKTDEPNIYIDFLQKMDDNLNSLEKECVKIGYLNYSKEVTP